MNIKLKEKLILTLLFSFFVLSVVPFVSAQSATLDPQQQQQQIMASSYFLLPDYELYMLVGIVFGMGFAPLFLVLIRCPEAITFISCQTFGGIIVERSDDSGIVEFIRAKPYGHEGQYIAGPDRFGRRIIFVVPRLNGKDFAKRYILKGIKRPLFDAYGGKTVLVNKAILTAIEITEFEDKNKLPANIAEWAKANNIETTTVVKDGPNTKIKTVVEKLFTLDSRKLRQYFAKHYDPSQFDALLERKYIQGVNFGRGAKKSGGNGWILILVAVLVVAAVVVLVLMSKGIIK